MESAPSHAPDGPQRTPRTARHDRARNRLRAAVDGDAPRRGRLELCRHAQQQILAPERRDQLDADRQPGRRLPDGQADGRLAGDAEWGREAPDAFEPRQDRERVGGRRQELLREERVARRRRASGAGRSRLPTTPTLQRCRRAATSGWRSRSRR